jgi:hypothetical protein
MSGSVVDMRIAMYRAACARMPPSPPASFLPRSREGRRWSERDLEIVREGIRRGTPLGEIWKKLPKRTVEAVTTR